MDTLLLTTEWDLTLDASGDLAVTTGPYAIAQDVACACRLFLGELWYDTRQGLPYRSRVLGHLPAPAFLTAKLREVALTVPGTRTARPVLDQLGGDRNQTGKIFLTVDPGVDLVVGGPLGGTVPWYVTAAGPTDAITP